MIEFTNEQLDAIKPQGSLIITACPGSGKTAVMSEKIRIELDTLKKHQGVIAITFTRKASRELADRCKKNSTDVKSSFFGTIDSFCLSEIIHPFIRHVFASSAVDLTPKYPADLTEAEKKLACQFIEEESYTEGQNLDVLLELLAAGTLYFPAIASLANYIIKQSAACSKFLKARYTSVYMDEYQDTSYEQHSLFLIMESLGITGIAVGDLQQSIFGWRGSSPEHLKDLIRNPKFTHRTIARNHRCHPSISNYANRLFNDRFILLENNDIRVWHCEMEGDQREGAFKLNRLIEALLAKWSTIPPSQIAILARGNATLKHLAEKLTIPRRIHTDNAIEELGTRTTELWGQILTYRYSPAHTVDEVLEILPDHGDLKKRQLIDRRSIIKKFRAIDDCLLESSLVTASQRLLGLEAKPEEIAALKKVILDKEQLQQYLPASHNEVQCMTLHKSKGLEFEIVLHLDLIEYVMNFPSNDPITSKKIYKSWEQDLNLHYVGITRAKNLCVLVHTTKRIGKHDVIYDSTPSPFLNLPGIKGLSKSWRYNL
ncbi:UNVERIFIED_ORG: DNA helicase-2/ATP-dependent DNA helicase PcrA [Pseudomonas parafulva]|nr:DNA helicase-2/ATP-dependent DNA helicase PcrA [Pseudomonas parafulva]